MFKAVSSTPAAVEDLSKEDIARYIMGMIHRMVMHYAFWFHEVRHQMGD